MSRALLAATALLLLSVTGCTYQRSYYTHYRSPPPPPEVRELDIMQAGVAVTYPQSWMRDTLLVNLEGVSGSGRILLTPHRGKVWPMRLAFRVTPGAVGVLEVYADKRSVLPITDAGRAVELQLDPGVYNRQTSQIAVAWHPAAAASVASR